MKAVQARCPQIAPPVWHSGSARPNVHPVQLMGIDEVAALALRRKATISGRWVPTYAGSAQICSQRAYLPRCEKRIGHGQFRRNATQSAVDGEPPRRN